MRRSSNRRLVVLCMLSLLVSSEVAGCSSSTLPSAPGPTVQVVSMLLTPDRSSLKVGATIVFAASLLMSDGTMRSVNPTWSVDSAVAGIVDSAGKVTGLAPGSVVVRATFEGTAASRSLVVVPDFQGTWFGQFKRDTCVRVSGPGSSPCRFLEGAVLILQLDIAHSGAADVSGKITFFTSGPTREVPGPPAEAGAVSGQIAETGTLTISGSTSPVQEDQGSTLLSEWATGLQTQAVMTGRFVMTQTFYNAFGLQVLTEECTIIKLQRLQDNR